MSEDRLLRLLADLRPQSAAVCEVAREARQQIMMLREVAAQLEANVAAYRDKLDDLTEQRADLQQDRARLRAARDAALLNHTAALRACRLEVGRMRDETIALREQLTAAEAAREAVLASLAAAEAVAGEVRGEAAKAVCHYCRVGAPFVETPYGRNGRWHQNDVDPLVCSWCSASAIHAIPTPSAALQRVREQAVADFLARCEPKPSEESVKKIVASMFPTPDAGGPT